MDGTCLCSLRETHRGGPGGPPEWACWTPSWVACALNISILQVPPGSFSAAQDVVNVYSLQESSSDWVPEPRRFLFLMGTLPNLWSIG